MMPGLVALGGLAAAGRAADLLIDVQGARTAKGGIRVAIYRSAGGNDKKGITAGTNTVPAGNTLVKFAGLEPGAYAVTLFHDENDNGALDKNAMGLPTEGCGFGNNARVFFGPTAFEKMAVPVSDGKNHSAPTGAGH